MKKTPKDLDSYEAGFWREWSSGGSAVKDLSGCPSVDLLRASQVGVLPDDWQEQLAGHVAACPLCRQLLADFDVHEQAVLEGAEVGPLLARVRSDATKEGPRTGWRFFRRPLVAVPALALIAVLAWLGFRGRTVQPSPSEAVQVPRQPVATSFVLPLVAPEVKLTLAAITWRGGQTGENPLLKDLAPAFDAYRAGHYEQAAVAMEPLVQEYPQAIEVHFFLGVSRLLSGRPRQGLEALRAAERLKEELFAPDVTWYLAVALERTGQAAEASALLKTLCAGRSERAAAACTGLEEFSKRKPGATGP